MYTCSCCEWSKSLEVIPAAHPEVRDQAAAQAGREGPGLRMRQGRGGGGEGQAHEAVRGLRRERARVRHDEQGPLNLALFAQGLSSQQSPNAISPFRKR